MATKHLNQIDLADRWTCLHRTLERWRWTGEGPQFIKLGGRVVVPARRRRGLRSGADPPRTAETSRRLWPWQVGHDHPLNRPSLLRLAHMPVADVVCAASRMFWHCSSKTPMLHAIGQGRQGLARWRHLPQVLRRGAHRRAEGKDTGTARFQDGSVTVVADLPKRVEWDQRAWPTWSSASRPMAKIPVNTWISPSRSPSASTPPGPRTSVGFAEARDRSDGQGDVQADPRGGRQ